MVIYSVSYGDGTPARGGKGVPSLLGFGSRRGLYVVVNRSDIRAKWLSGILDISECVDSGTGEHEQSHILGKSSVCRSNCLKALQDLESMGALKAIKVSSSALEMMTIFDAAEPSQPLSLLDAGYVYERYGYWRNTLDRLDAVLKHYQATPGFEDVPLPYSYLTAAD